MIDDGGNSGRTLPLPPSSHRQGGGGVKVEPGRDISPRGAELFGSPPLPGVGAFGVQSCDICASFTFGLHPSKTRIFTHGGGTARPDRLWVQRVRFALERAI